MELVDSENSPYLEVDNSVVLVRVMVVENLAVLVSFLVLEAESELEVSLMMMKVLRQFLLSLSSSLLVSLALVLLASLVAEEDLQTALVFRLHRCIGGLLLCSELWRRQLARGTFRWWFRPLFAFLNIFW